MKRVIVAVAVTAVVLAVAPQASAKPPNAAEVAARTRLLDRIDGFRVGADLVEDAFVSREAYLHSKRMATTNTLSHSGFRKRFRRINENDPDVTALCENVAVVSGLSTPHAAADRIFAGWRNSAGHRNCMERAAANTAGVGVERRAGKWWATFIAADDATP